MTPWPTSGASPSGGWGGSATPCFHPQTVATASGHNGWSWPRRVPAVHRHSILACPLLARLHRAGQTQPSCVDLAHQMLTDLLAWFPNRTLTLVGDGAYASRGLLTNRDERVVFVGRMRGDAAVYDPPCPQAGQEAPRPQAQERPATALTQGSSSQGRPQADDGRGLGVASGRGDGVRLPADAVGLRLRGGVAAGAGVRPVRVVVVRDPEGTLDDIYLFCTDRQADPGWVITPFAWRWSIEVLFRSSKQVLDIEARNTGVRRV